MRPCVDRLHAEVGEIQQRRPEAGRGDHVVGLEHEIAGLRRAVSTMHPEAVRVALDPLDRRVERERARRRVPRPRAAAGSGREPRRARAPRSAPAAASRARSAAPRGAARPRSRSPEFRLPITKTRLSAYCARLPARDVVRRPARSRGSSRLPRLGHADREHGRLAAVLAVRGRRARASRRPRAASTPSGSRSAPARRPARRTRPCPPPSRPATARPRSGP